MKHYKLSVILLALMLSTTPTVAGAQQVSTCGWHFLIDVPRPASIEQLVARSAGDAELLSAATRLDAWYRDCDATAAREAVLQLRRVAGSSPVRKALLGVALVRGPEVQLERSSGQWLRALHSSTNAEREGVRLLADVVVQTGWFEVGDELATAAIASGNSQSLRAARAALAAAAAKWEGSLRADLAEIDLALADTQSAKENAARVLAPFTARARRVAALSASAASPDSSARLYLAALADAREREVVHRFFDDLRLLLEPEELREWSALTANHADWIRRKWEWRAFTAGATVAERLAVHHERLRIALRDYRRASHRGATPASAIFMHANHPLDDRGVLYVRHGAPEKAVQARSNQRVAWIYQGPAGYHVYEFGRSASRADYYVLEPHPVCSGRHVITGQRPVGYPPLTDRLGWAMTLASYDRSLSDYYTRCESGSQFAALHFVGARDQARERALAGYSTETAIPGFARPITVAANVYSFPVPNGTEIVAYVAFQAAAVSAASTNSQLYSLDLRVAAGHPETEQVIVRDTTLRFTLPQPARSDLTVALPVGLTVPWTTYARIAITLTNSVAADEGQFVSTRKDFVRSTTDELRSSDIVIAELRDGIWRRGDVALAPALGHVRPAGEAFRVYYELHGLNQGDRVRTSITIAPSRESMGLLESLISMRRAATISFEDEAQVTPGGVYAVVREFQPELEDGSYVVSITTTNSRTGTAVSAHTNLVIVQRP